MIKKLKRLLFQLILLILLTPVVLIGVFKFVDPPLWGWRLARLMDPPQGYPNQVQHQWVPFEQIAGVMPLAVMASEDQKFPNHYGIDVSALLDVVNEARQGVPVRGASTITQQTAKNVFLVPAHSYWRKAYELYIALWLEAIWGKQRIMEVYLNVIEFGPGIYGVQAASKHYFNTSANQLTSTQAAQLAAVLPNPYTIKVWPITPYTQQRIQWIQRQMHNLGAVSLSK